MVYFIIPISLILLAIFGSIYFFVNRRNRSSQSSLRNTGAHAAFHHPSMFSGSSGKKDLGVYHNMTAVHSLTTTAQSSNHSNGKTINVSLPLSVGDNTSCRSELQRVPSKSMQQYSQSDAAHNLQLRAGYSPQSSQQPRSPSDYYCSSLPFGQTAVAYAPHLPYWGPPAPSVATEMSFDQYSAVGQTGPGSSQSTNHYMNPFPEFPRIMNETSGTNSSQGTPFAFPPSWWLQWWLRPA